MNEKYKKLTLNTIIFAIGSFGTKIISFFLVPIYTNILSTGEYGTVDLIMAIANLFLPVISFSIAEAILFFGLRKKDNNEKILKNGLIACIIGSIGMLAICPFLSLYKPLKGYSIYLAIYTVSMTFRQVLQFYTKSIEKNIIYTIDSIIHALCVCVFNILFLVVFKFNVWGYLYAMLLSEIVSVVFLLIYNKGIKVFITQAIDWELLKKMIIYCAPLIINSISWSISHSTDKMMLESMVSIEAVGLYAVSSKIPTLVNTLTNFFCQAWTMSAIMEYGNKDTKFYDKTFSMFSMILCLATSCVLLILKPFMQIYVGKDFREAWIYVPFLLLAAIFQNYSSFFGSIIQSGQENKKLLLTSLISCFINIGLNLLLIPLYGVQGAIWGTFGSYIVVGIMRMFFSHKICSFNTHIFRLILSVLILVVQSILVINQVFVYISSLVSIFLLVSLFYKDIHMLVLFFVKKLLKK